VALDDVGSVYCFLRLVPASIYLHWRMLVSLVRQCALCLRMWPLRSLRVRVPLQTGLRSLERRSASVSPGRMYLPHTSPAACVPHLHTIVHFHPVSGAPRVPSISGRIGRRLEVDRKTQTYSSGPQCVMHIVSRRARMLLIRPLHSVHHPYPLSIFTLHHVVCVASFTRVRSLTR
jgi:hypothetical protein